MQPMPTAFPGVDPIPLPAPVWLFKVLHDLTLTLHFGALFLFLGGLGLGILWNALGHRRHSLTLLAASGVMATRLPVIMTYVINFGVPPLLFAQVLYGRALYTSSILIGTYWIAVVFLLMLSYFLLYRMNGRAAAGRPWWHLGLLSLVTALAIARIYSTNMTLMLRPDAWAGLYQASATGHHLSSPDPTLDLRWLLMLTSSLGFGGLGCILYSLKSTLGADVRTFLARGGGLAAVIGLVLTAVCGVLAFRAQPSTVQYVLTHGALHQGAMLAWVAGLILGGGTALGVLARPAGVSRGTLGRALAAGLLGIGGHVVVRDGVRDQMLLSYGLDVWKRDVVTNWSVVGAFVGFLLAGVAVLVWLALVMKRARPLEERYVDS